MPLNLWGYLFDALSIKQHMSNKLRNFMAWPSTMVVALRL